LTECETKWLEIVQMVANDYCHLPEEEKRRIDIGFSVVRNLIAEIGDTTFLCLAVPMLEAHHDAVMFEIDRDEMVQ